MRLVVPTLALVLATAAPVELTYQAPPDAATAGKLDAFVLTEYQPRAVVFAASDDVKVRRAADPDAPVVHTLDAGDEVLVLKRLARTRVLERVDHWYEIEIPGRADPASARGFVFGGALTPLFERADLDGDGTFEIVTLSLNWGFDVVVRVVDPDRPVGARAARVKWTPGGAWRGARLARVDVESAASAGIPLIRADVELGGPTKGAKTTHTVWWSYVKPGATAEPSVNEAISTYRSEDVRGEVSFDPAERMAVVRYFDKAGAPRGAPERYRLRDGVFVVAPGAPVSP